MPASIREWVDRMMNCEDIAMNFLVSVNFLKIILFLTYLFYHISG